jgi:Fe(3+) dicitrate transport protein
LQKIDLRNNRVENAPEHSLRTGAHLQYKQIKLTSQFNWVSGVYTDANNTHTASPNAQNGYIPGYSVVDLTLSFPIRKSWSIKTGVNNLTDAVYFTRRASGYPGPGALPADGRSAFLTVTYQMR